MFLLFSCGVVSDSLRPQGLQWTRLPCPSLSPRVCSNSCPLCRWHHPTDSSSVAPFSFCPQSFPASGSFPISQLFASGGQSIGVSASVSVLPMNSGLISFRIDWFDLLAVWDVWRSSKRQERVEGTRQRDAVRKVTAALPSRSCDYINIKDFDICSL